MMFSQWATNSAVERLHSVVVRLSTCMISLDQRVKFIFVGRLPKKLAKSVLTKERLVHYNGVSNSRLLTQGKSAEFSVPKGLLVQGIEQRRRIGIGIL